MAGELREARVELELLRAATRAYFIAQDAALSKLADEFLRAGVNSIPVSQETAVAFAALNVLRTAAHLGPNVGVEAGRKASP